MRIYIMIQLRDNQRCYVCGKENPAGLGVDFEIDKERRAISAKFTPSDIHQGYEGIVHGGILSTLLDEAMGKLTVSLGIPAVTVEITVTFKSPAAPGEELFISGRLTHEIRRLIHAEAKIERGPVLIAEATGKLLRISSESGVRSSE
ncbi:MAG: PaaI family thioesterase [Nitrospirae bacterium]|nr:PaaI family thioesterase [Nitrospirota bacterium]